MKRTEWVNTQNIFREIRSCPYPSWYRLSSPWRCPLWSPTWAGIPTRYYCRRSFATWDALLLSEELVVKLAGYSISLKFFWLQPEYKGKWRIKVTQCNISIQLNGDLLTTYLSEYGSIDVIAKSASGTALGNYVFTMCLDRGRFQAIPHLIEYEDQVMMVVVESRRPQCGPCKQLGHFTRSCPQKTNKTTSNTSTTITTAAAVDTATTTTNQTNLKTGDNHTKEGRTQVTWKRKKFPYKTINSNHNKNNSNNYSSKSTSSNSNGSNNIKSNSITSIISWKEKEKTVSTRRTAKDMDSWMNLKRRWDSDNTSR